MFFDIQSSRRLSSGFDAEGSGDLPEGGCFGVADLALGAARLRFDGGLGDALADEQQPAGVLGSVAALDPARQEVDRSAAQLQDVVVQAGAAVSRGQVVLLAERIDLLYESPFLFADLSRWADEWAAQHSGEPRPEPEPPPAPAPEPPKPESKASHH